MNSKFMLRITDPKINRDFELYRNKDIMLISILCLIIRTFELMTAILTVELNHDNLAVS